MAGALIRLPLILLLIFGVLAPSERAAAQSRRPATATWEPSFVRSDTLAGICPRPRQPEAPCPLRREETYRTRVSFRVDRPTDSLVLAPEPGGLALTAASASTGAEYTRPLSPGEVEQVDLVVRVPPANPRRPRHVYLGRVHLRSGSGRVRGSLIVSLVVRPPSVVWGRPALPAADPAAPPEPAPLDTVVGSGGTVSRLIRFASNVDVSDFALRVNNRQVELTDVPAALVGGEENLATLTFNAPVVSRRTRMSIVVRPTVGRRALRRTMRMRVTVLPTELRWSPPRVRNAIAAGAAEPVTIPVAVTSTTDVSGVRFRTADVGLAPVVAPIRPVDLEAGRSHVVAVRLCPGYAPSRYFLGIVAYRGSMPLRRRLPVWIRVFDDPPMSAAPATDPCGPEQDPARDELFDCEDFVSQALAQAFLRQYPNDPSRLDADRDGVACEANPGPLDRDPVPRS